MSLMRRSLLTALLACGAGACSDKGPSAANAVDRNDLGRFVAIRNCEGPATSLNPLFAKALAPRTGNMRPDDQWADLAERVPGGFAGFILDNGKPVLFLTDPSKAAAAKSGLAGSMPGFDVHAAEVRQARWDFAQLVNWYNYLEERTTVWLTPGITSGDKSESINRIVYGTVDSASRLELIEKLQALELPCDLIRVEVTGRITAL